MAKQSVFVRTSGLFLLALAVLAAAALFMFSGPSPVLAGSGDTTVPECVVLLPEEDEARIKLVIRDLESGLHHLSVTNSKNLEGLDMPLFIIGTNELVVVTGDVDDESLNARILVQAWDVAGNNLACVGNYFAP